MEGLFYIWISITLAGIMILLSIQYEHMLFGIIMVILWPITIPSYYLMKVYKKRIKKDEN